MLHSLSTDIENCTTCDTEKGATPRQPQHQYWPPQRQDPPCPQPHPPPSITDADPVTPGYSLVRQHTPKSLLGQLQIMAGLQPQPEAFAETEETA
jgi:hypothetical protein